MAEAVLLALAKISISLAGAAISDISERVSIIKDLPEKVQRVNAQLSVINGALQQLDSAYHNDHAYMEWIRYVRNLAHQVQDMMDKYSYHAHKFENQGFMSKLTQQYRGHFKSINEEIIKLEENLKNATELRNNWLQNFDFIPQQSGAGVLSLDYIPVEPNRETDLVRIKDNRRLMTEWVQSSDSNCMIITVLGTGGMGNTTLVTDVYERQKINFSSHCFITVERGTTMDVLLRKILLNICGMEQQSSESIDNMHANEMKEEIRLRIRAIKDGRCLIVLDNVRDPKIYIEICNVANTLHGSRIIITTRKTQVAAARDPSSRGFLQLEALSTTDAFHLFCRKAFFKMDDNTCPPELKEVATSVIHECKGLPLAIVTMGGLMSSKPPVKEIWNQTYARLQQELQRNADYVQAILNLSYHDMPGHLRNCLLYCTMFPEDYHMSRESLVRLWIAEGCVLTVNCPIPETIAEEYFMELIRRNMLHTVDNDELGRVRTCKMHDLVRKMILSIATEEMFNSATNYSAMMYIDKDVRHLSSYGWKDTTTVQVSFPRLRSLVGLGTNSFFSKILSTIFTGSTFLTVLVVQDSAVTEVPASLGDLFNLRYISLRRTQVKSLPESIEKLSNLETLDIKQTKIRKLPHRIERMRKLRHILGDNFVDGSKSDFQSFTGLEAPKSISNCGDLQTLDTAQASTDMAKWLVKMQQLRNVSIDNISAVLCAELIAAVSELQFLSCLSLSATDEKVELSLQNFEPKSTSCLSKLTVRGRFFETTLDCPIFKDHAGYLTYLSLSWCHIGDDPLQFLASHVRYLIYLHLERVESASSLVLPEKCFRELRTIVLDGMPDVNKLTVRDGALKSIEFMYIMALPNLEKVPQGIELLSSLKKLYLLDLHKDFKAHWDETEMQQKMSFVADLRI